MNCRHQTDRKCYGCAPGDCAYQYDRAPVQRKHTNWERQLLRGMLAGPVLALAVVGIVSLYVLAGVIKALSWINGEYK